MADNQSPTREVIALRPSAYQPRDCALLRLLWLASAIAIFDLVSIVGIAVTWWSYHQAMHTIVIADAACSLVFAAILASYWRQSRLPLAAQGDNDGG
jgi:hypothetical protein